MEAKTYFHSISTLVIIIHLIFGVSAIYLIERQLSHPDKDNALLTLKNAVVLHSNLQKSMIDGVNQQNRSLFFSSLDEIEKNSLDVKSAANISNLKIQADQYWSGDRDKITGLSNKINEIVQESYGIIQAEEDKTRVLGISSSWALAFLVFISIFLQLNLRSKLFSILMEPMNDLLSVIRDYSAGNLLRRFHNSNAAKEIKDAGELLNSILDKKM